METEDMQARQERELGGYEAERIVDAMETEELAEGIHPLPESHTPVTHKESENERETE
jgi:hypothetical protein